MTEKYKINVSNKAENDLKSLVLYIKNELNELIIAKRYFEIIKREIKNLEYFPQRFSYIDDDSIKDLNMRKLIIKNYIVFYIIDEDNKVVTVERILYGGVNWINKL